MVNAVAPVPRHGSRDESGGGGGGGVCGDGDGQSSGSGSCGSPAGRPDLRKSSSWLGRTSSATPGPLLSADGGRTVAVVGAGPTRRSSALADVSCPRSAPIPSPASGT